MRWLVEVSSLGKTDTQKFCVEAESWQRALQAARSQRGEDGPMSGFSIELLEEGYRAVDPLARVRFVVKRAPDDMPITAAAPKEAKGGVAPTAPASSAKAPASASSAKAPASASSPKAPAAAPAAVMSSSSDATTPNLPPSPSSSSVGVGKKAPPRPGQSTPGPSGPAKSTPPPAGSGAAHLHAASDLIDGKKKSQTMVFSSAGDASVVDQPIERAAPPAIGSAIPGLPAVKLLTSREQNPNDASPLTYREYAFAVAEGTSEEAAAEVLRAQLRYVEAHIATAKTGKLVNLAVFDVEFTGKPPRPPVATLTWKDWKGDPVIAFPRRGGGQSKPPRPPSKTPPSMLASAAGGNAIAIPQAGPVPQVAQAAPVAVTPAPPPPPAHVAAPEAQVVVAAQPAFPPAPQQAQQHPSVPPAPAFQQPQQPPSVPPPPPPPPQAQKQPSVPPPPPPAAFPAQTVNPFPAPAAAPHAFAPVAPPEPTFTEAASQPPPAGSNMVKTPSGRFVRGRVTGDELITSLFESMHDLHFLRDALDGGQFCLALATEVLPARAAIIHFFDIEKREWVVACTRGKEMHRLLAMRAPETDELLRECARKRRALVVPDASQATSERYRQLNGARSLIAAPIMQAGRALGALEIINPLDGMPFTEDEGNAMTYIAEQYAEYLGSRGIVLDRERIHSAAAAR